MAAVRFTGKFFILGFLFVRYAGFPDAAAKNKSTMSSIPQWREISEMLSPIFRKAESAILKKAVIL